MTNVTSLQSRWYELGAAIDRLSPQVNSLDRSDDQKVIAMKMEKLRAKQRRIQGQIATVLDGELSERETLLQKEFTDGLAALQTSSLEDMDSHCRDLVTINKRRLDLHEEVKRCSRICGRGKPAFPRHPGVRQNEMKDPAKIRLAVLGLGQSRGTGSGQISTWGGLRP